MNAKEMKYPQIWSLPEWAEDDRLHGKWRCLDCGRLRLVGELVCPACGTRRWKAVPQEGTVIINVAMSLAGGKP